MLMNCLCSQAREELDAWGLQLDPRMIQLEGRVLGQEKIMFRNATHPAGPEADWSHQAVKENVISAVSGGVIYVCCVLKV